MLALGSKGRDVVELQTLLNRHGASLTIDGDFGPATEAALKQIQRQNGLSADGIYGPQTLRALSQTDAVSTLAEAATLLGVDRASIQAIQAVESNGSGFLSDGRCTLLFERHIFYRELSQALGVATAKRQQALNPDICNPVTGGYLGGAREYPRWTKAQTIHPTAALRSASYGMFQIMGFNHGACGFADVFSFVAAMNQDEDQQLLAFCRFIKANKLMHQALKDRNWATFARLYNGPAYAKNQYDVKLAQAYRRFAA